VRQHISDHFPVIGHPLYQMNESIQRLQEEHVLLKDALNELYAIAKSIGKTEEPITWVSTLRTLREKTAAYLAELDEHARWEDEELFPMVQTYFGEEMEQFNFMEQDHELAEQYIQAFLEASERAPVRRYEATEMASYLMQAHTVLANHFRMEEEIIIALWERADDYGY